MADIPTVGTLFEPDFEALAAMAPALIVAGGRSQSQVTPLSRVTPTLDMTIGDGDLIEEARARIDAYGAIYAKTAEAEALKARLQADLDAARTATAGKGNALILMTNGGKIPPMALNRALAGCTARWPCPRRWPGFRPTPMVKACPSNSSPRPIPTGCW